MSILQSNSDAPVSVLAALVDALSEPGRYTIVSRGGEFFIQPSRVHRFARRRRWQAMLRPTAAL